jgi:hypothetical protein
LHYYPHLNNVALSPAGNAETQALRLRSTRSLWDPTYQDEGWISDVTDEPVQFIPRMKQWVDNNYPGTKLAITEYNWGALDHINGALAQADVLGIFGREGLDLATLWGPPEIDEPGTFAFRMYRNYDGSGSAFGETSVQASSADQGQVSIYAAQRASDGALTLVIINKTGQGLTSDVSLAHFTPAAYAQVYRYSATNLGAIVQLADQAFSGSGFSALFPANSITLVVIPPGGGPLTDVSIDGPTTGDVDTDHTFEAVVSPLDASAPITYTWSPAPLSGQYSSTAVYNWSTLGAHTIMVTAENTGGIATDTHTITVTGIAVTGVTIDGPAVGDPYATYAFTATVSPANASPPISYTWSPPPLSGQDTPVATYSWSAFGDEVISVTAFNNDGSAVMTHTIAVGGIPITGVNVSGPDTGVINTSDTFTAEISPVDASEPFTYTWQPEPSSGHGTSTVVYDWTTLGSQTITLTVVNRRGVATDTHVVTVVDVPVTGVTIDGPMMGDLDTTYAFTATASPANASPPITYTWSPAPLSGQGTAVVTYRWDTFGSQTISVTASNAGGVAADQHDIDIMTKTFVPFVSH